MPPTGSTDLHRGYFPQMTSCFGFEMSYQILKRKAFLISIVGAVIVFSLVYIASNFDLSALQRPSKAETFLATKTKHLLVARHLLFSWPDVCEWIRSTTSSFVSQAPSRARALSASHSMRNVRDNFGTTEEWKFRRLFGVNDTSEGFSV